MKFALLLTLAFVAVAQPRGSPRVAGGEFAGSAPEAQPWANSPRRAAVLLKNRGSCRRQQRQFH